MSERPNKSTRNPEKSAVPAIELAREMLCELAGPRGWHDTRESWLARGARRAGLTLRRARAIFYQEPLRLTADEYLGIQRAYTAAHEAVAQMVHLAGDQDLRRRARADEARNGSASQGGQVASPARRRPAKEIAGN